MQYRNRIGNNKSDLITMLFIFAKEKKQFNKIGMMMVSSILVTEETILHLYLFCLRKEKVSL